jgi:hypothetical protein
MSKAKKFSIKEIKRCIEDIKEEAAVLDHEKAHILEDALRGSFIEYIAEEYEGEIADMAKEILSTDYIDFQRWYA